MVCMMSGVLFQGWDNGTLGNTLRVCVTQGSRVGPSEASAIHHTHTNVCVCVCGTWTRVYTQSSLSIFTTLDTAVLPSVHAYGAQMWTVLKWRMITMFNRKLLEKQRVSNPSVVC